MHTTLHGEFLHVTHTPITHDNEGMKRNIEGMACSRETPVLSGVDLQVRPMGSSPERMRRRVKCVKAPVVILHL